MEQTDRTSRWFWCMYYCKSKRYPPAQKWAWDEANKAYNDMIYDFDSLSKDPTFMYMLLGRLKLDCDAFIGGISNRAGRETELWAGCVENHIRYMIDIYKFLFKYGIPQWINANKIFFYKREMYKVLNNGKNQ